MLWEGGTEEDEECEVGGERKGLELPGLVWIGMISENELEEWI